MSTHLSNLNLEEIILANSTNQSDQRGKEYFQQGYVSNVVNRDNLIQAEVEGSQGEDYSVNIHISPQGVESANCTCPYDWGGWCKHIIATLYYCEDYPNNIQERPSLEQLLDSLNQQQLHNLIVKLVEQDSGLITTIEKFVERLCLKTTSKNSLISTIDIKPIRNQVRGIIKEGIRQIEEGWDEEDYITDELCDLISDSETLISEGEVENALLMLEAITETCMENWDEPDDYGIEGYYVAEYLDQVFAQGLLASNLDESGKVDWEVKLEFWSNEWSVNFPLSLAILSNGWGCLETKTKSDNTQFVYQPELDNHEHKLNSIRLKVLEYQQRYEDYLYLAKTTKEIESYLTCLARIGRIDLAFEEGQKLITNQEEALALAEVFNMQGELEKALVICQIGLTKTQENEYQTKSTQIKLAQLTIDLAEKLNDSTTVLNGKIKLFKASPSEHIYLEIQELARDNWQEIKLDLLSYLRGYNDWYGKKEKINIFLNEKLFDEAIKLLEKDSYSLEENMLAKIIPHNPDWVIKQAIAQAEPIMDSGKAKYYHRAVSWLTQARNAYYHADNVQKWRNYCQKLTELHGRKYKLMGLLKPILH